MEGEIMITRCDVTSKILGLTIPKDSLVLVDVSEEVRSLNYGPNDLCWLAKPLEMGFVFHIRQKDLKDLEWTAVK